MEKLHRTSVNDHTLAILRVAFQHDMPLRNNDVRSGGIDCDIEVIESLATNVPPAKESQSR
jgi:hypothetical protein